MWYNYTMEKFMEVVTGQPSQLFEHLKSWAFRRPESLHLHFCAGSLGESCVSAISKRGQSLAPLGHLKLDAEKPCNSRWDGWGLVLTHKKGKYNMRCFIRHVALPQFSPNWDVPKHLQDCFCSCWIWPQTMAVELFLYSRVSSVLLHFLSPLDA